jgi:putative phosphoesterase
MADPRTIAVLADCHIHPPKIDWPPAALAALKGVDLIITLGDMGARSGRDVLMAIAPVVSVRGGDDEDDPDTAQPVRRLELAGVRFGCVFDPARQGIVPADRATVERVFGGPIDVLLRASTHVASQNRENGRLEVDPGSVTLPAEGEPSGSFALLRLADGRCEAEIVRL